MAEYIRHDKSNCRSCRKCIRYCPVKAISFEEGQANILADECVLCGQCLITCPQRAKYVGSSIERVKALIAIGWPVYASVGSSFPVAFVGVSFDDLAQCLKQLGFAGAQETSVGASIVRRCYEDMVAKGGQSVIISSACHSVNLTVQKYFPSLLPLLAPFKSPMLTHGDYIKRRNPGAMVVSIGPCVSQKAEADSYPGSVDCVLTFDELARWMESEGIVPEAGALGTGSTAGMYCVTGGIVRDMTFPEGSGYQRVVIDGVDNCMAALKDISAGRLDSCFVEISACAGGCIGGPAMGSGAFSPVRGRVAVGKHAAIKEPQTDMPDIALLHKDFSPMPRPSPLPDESAIETMLQSMGKSRTEDRLNCGSCGYETCRDKAEAILLGRAEISMCLPRLMENAKSFSDTIIRNTPNGIMVLNRDLEIQQINQAACGIFGVADPKDVLGGQIERLIDLGSLIQVVVDGRNLYDSQIWLAEHRRWIVVTIVHEKGNDIIICIIRDITAAEKERILQEELSARAVGIADRVIEKHMRTVQEIASLLGETTADTKVALTTLKETLRRD